MDTSRSKRTLTIVPLTLALGVLLAVTPVQAAYPGVNGRISFAACDQGGCLISTMLPDGSDVRQLTGGVSSDWSPDGHKIVFDSDRNRPATEVFTMNADGSDVHQVTHLDGFTGDPSWGPDGNLLVFEHFPPRGCCGNIWTSRPHGTGLRLVTHFTSSENTPLEPEFSPDGQRIAFWEASPGGGSLAAIFVMRADGTDIRQVTPFELDADHPEWSPDGSKIVFNNDAHQGVGDIFTIRPDGRGLRQVTNVSPLGEADFRPDYSPDGTMIVFNHEGPDLPPGTDAVLTMMADGSNVKVIRANGFAFAPDWGPQP